MIWGPIPLKRPSGPSLAAIYRMTSLKVLNGLPSRPGGGRDWRPTLATMRGWVAIVARAFERAPRTARISHTKGVVFPGGTYEKPPRG